METRRWTNPSQPQTLQIAVFLLYFRAFFGLLEGLAGGSPLFVLIAIGQGVGGYGIANEKRWGYSVGLAMSFAPAALRVLASGPGAVLAVNPITLLFEVALIALLLHPQSRDYQRIWFS
jgi:hypothetical protein